MTRVCTRHRQQQERFRHAPAVNKVAIVTGAASGIGRSAAQLFAREGACVVVADIDAAAAAAIATGIRADGGNAIAITTDVTQSDSVAAAIEATVAEFGKLDILYNNAGGRRRATTRWSTPISTSSGASSRSTCGAPSLAAASRYPICARMAAVQSSTWCRMWR